MSQDSALQAEERRPGSTKAKKGRSARRAAEVRVAYLFLLPTFAFFSVFVLYPVLRTFYLTFMR